MKIKSVDRKENELTVIIQVPENKFSEKACKCCGFDGDLKKENAGDPLTATTLWAFGLVSGIFFPPAFLVPVAYEISRRALPLAHICPKCGNRTEHEYSVKPD